MIPYSCGDRVCFVDEDQCEVRGIVCGCEDRRDYILVIIDIDEGGKYFARLMKKEPPIKYNNDKFNIPCE